MAIQLINTGTSANAGNGDSIRAAFNKVNNNFDYLNGIVLGTSTNFNSGVRDVVKPMLVHDAHRGLFADYSTLNNRIILTVSDVLTATNLTLETLAVSGTSTLNNVVMTGDVTMGFIQGYDDISIVKYAEDGSLNFRMKNTFGLGSSEINILDDYDGSFNIVHQNSGANSGFYGAGQNYIFDDYGRAINIGRNSNINFYADQSWNGYTSPALSITTTGTIVANGTLRINTSTLYLNNMPVNISETDITINGTPLIQNLPATIYTATITSAGITDFSSNTPLSSGGSIDLNNGKLNIEYPKQFNFLTNDYTIEWFQYAQVPEYIDNTIFNYGDTNNPELTAYYSNAIFYVKSKGVVVLSAPMPAPYLFTWRHFVVERSNGVLTLYIDGVAADSIANLDNITTSTVFTIGDNVPEDVPPEFKFTGFITNFRIAKSAIYDGNFTVPTDPLPATLATTLLLVATNSSTYLADSSNSSVSLPLRTEVSLSGKTWTFDTDSVISLPLNGDIVNSDGVSLLSNKFNQELNTYNDVSFNKATISTTATINGELTSLGVIYQGTANTAEKIPGTTIRTEIEQPNYTQMIMKNLSAATTATSDLIIVRNDGDAATGSGVIDIGINSSNYQEDQPFGLHTPGSAYMFTNDADLIIGTQTPGSKIIFHAGGATSNDSAGILDGSTWRFNRSVQTIVGTPGPLNFTVWNTQNNSAAQAIYQAMNDAGEFLQVGLNSTNPNAAYGAIGPREGFVHIDGSTATLHIGGSGDLVFWSDEPNGGYETAQTATLYMSRVDRTSTFGGHVLPAADLTYDLGSTSSQWRSLHVGTSTVYFGGIPLTVNGNGDLSVNGVNIVSGNANTGDFAFNGNILSTDVGMALQLNSGALDITNGAHNWQFKDDGTISFPNNVTVDTNSGNFAVVADNYITLETLGPAQIEIGRYSPEGSLVIVGSTSTPLIVESTKITYAGDITQSQQDATSCPPAADTVIYTATGQNQYAIKLFVMVEGSENGGMTTETQACDIIAVKGNTNNIVHITAYGVTYTGAAALATFDGQWNATTGRIEITCRPVSGTETMTASVHAIEMTSNI